MRRVRRLVASAAALALAGSACSGSGSSTTTAADPSPGTTGATGTTAAQRAPDADLGGRLLISDDSGNLITMTPQGTDVVALTEDAGERLQFLQPTWSPDGERIAWTEVDGRGGPVNASLVTSTVAGDGQTRAAVSFPPFYLYWDPTSTRLAYLGNGATRLEMGILDVAAGGDTATEIDGGQPYYFAWSPNGEELLVHVGALRLQRLDLSGQATDLGPQPGNFPAPGWSADGSVMAYAVNDGVTQYLAVADGRGDNELRITEFDGFVNFVLSPDGGKVAFQAFNRAPQQGITAFAPGVLAAGAPTAQQASAGALSIADTETGEVTTVSLSPELAFFWSPQGDRLLSLGRASSADSGRVRWQVWDGAASFVGEPFTPSRVFLTSYLPFFDQYAHSMSLWSPDGTAFAYAGEGTSGESGIWVQRIQPDTPPVLVGDGTFVAWSPA